MSNVQDILKIEPLLTRYVESHEDYLPKERVSEYYQRMAALYEEEGDTNKAAHFRDRSKRFEQ